MSAIEIETSSEAQRAVRAGFFGEHAQELGSVVPRNLPMFYKRAFRFLGNATVSAKFREARDNAFIR
jgi:hypothetical protein